MQHIKDDRNLSIIIGSEELTARFIKNDKTDEGIRRVDSGNKLVQNGSQNTVLRVIAFQNRSFGTRVQKMPQNDILGTFSSSIK